MTADEIIRFVQSMLVPFLAFTIAMQAMLMRRVILQLNENRARVFLLERVIARIKVNGKPFVEFMD